MNDAKNTVEEQRVKSYICTYACDHPTNGLSRLYQAPIYITSMMGKSCFGHIETPAKRRHQCESVRYFIGV